MIPFCIIGAKMVFYEFDSALNHHDPLKYLIKINLVVYEMLKDRKCEKIFV